MEEEITTRQEMKAEIEKLRRRMAELEQSEHRLSILIDNLPGALYRCRNDRNWTMEYLSEGCEKLVGYPAKDLLNKSPLSYTDLIYPEDRQSVWDSIQSALKEKRPYQITYRIQTAQGNTKWFWEKGSGVFDEKGDVSALEGFITDVSEHRHAEEALLESEIRYQTLLENVIVAVYIIQDNTFRFVNKRFCELYGYSNDEIVNKLTPVDVTYVDDKEIVAENVRKRLSGEVDDIHYTTRALRKNGEVRFVEIFGSSMIYKGRRAILGTIIDITEANRTEEALKEREKFLSSIIENIPDMIFIKDAKELRYIRLNRAGENLLGYKREDMIGKNDYDFFPKDQADFFTKKDLEVLESGQIHDIPEEPIDTKRGRRILHTKKIPILDKNGSPAYLLGISEDISDRKRAEQDRERLQAQLTQKQKLESIGRLAGGVAHDFNNMLGVIIGFTELAMCQIDRTQPLFADLQEIWKAAKRSADLTSQLLAFARKQTVAPRILDINETVEGILKILRRLIGEDINLAWLPGTSIGPIKIDPSQIDQILANLFVNARDAIEGVGKVTVETQSVTLDEIYAAGYPEIIPGKYVLLAVSDDGHGMDKETLDNIFEPFFTTKEDGKGTGLGLATVYGIVKQNHGFINVYSEPGQGTTFKIYLPLHRRETEEVEGEEQISQMPHGQETILLVEDEQVILKMGKQMLERIGYHVLIADQPNVALALAREHASKISLLITDVIMPGMNGRALEREVTSFCPGLKSLYMSGYTSNVIAHHGILEDGVNFIQKPFSIQTLAAKVREVLDGK